MPISYASIMLDAFAHLLCWHNRLRPNHDVAIYITFQSKLGGMPPDPLARAC